MLRLRTAGPVREGPELLPGPTGRAGSMVLWSVSCPADLMAVGARTCTYPCVHTQRVCMGVSRWRNKRVRQTSVILPPVSNSQHPAFSHRGGVICNIPETPECKGGQFLVSRGLQGWFLRYSSLEVVPRFGPPTPSFPQRSSF